MFRVKSPAFLLSLFCILAGTPLVFAAGASFQTAVAHYNSGKYGQALSEFRQFEASYPTNAMSHYYIALCSQALGDRAEARKEFNLTNQYGDASLKNYAQRALSSMGGPVSTQGSGSSSLSSTSSTATSVAATSSSPGVASNGALTYSPAQLMAAAHNGSNGAPTDVSSTTQNSNGAAAKNSSSAGITEVIEFYTDWCPVCRKFAPLFNDAQAKLSGVTFRSYNAEDADNAALVQKYSVSRYPTLVYLDRSGKVVRNLAIAYNSTTDFVNSIRWGR